eukprot:TRINITY_DN1562_c0_g1_i1.p1 TRINITY_DN1562_c0_g1~~TRINITY_DN1562_c0_g1_i1.p1  ORF type:complete len:134 (-),score=22.67 TRINITY_DN1562_c0_g1_i1:21-398(-)
MFAWRSVSPEGLCDLGKVFARSLWTRNAAKKRFRVTGGGNIKCFPSNMNGTAKLFTRKHAEGGYSQCWKLISHSTPLQGKIKLTATQQEAKQLLKQKKLVQAKPTTTLSQTNTKNTTADLEANKK